MNAAFALEERKVWVLGLGLSGCAVARFAASRGAQVVGVDLRTELAQAEELAGLGVRVELGGDRVAPDSADLLVLSPGVDPRRPDVLLARERGVEVLGEVELALGHLAPACPIVAVSGTNGKSTTVSLLGQIVRSAGLRAFVGGNLGLPLISAVDQVWECCVLELSSYQLETTVSLDAKVAILTQLAPDHLERHGSFATYAQTKRRVLEAVGPGGLCVVPDDDPAIDALLEGLEAPIARVSVHGSVASEIGAWLRGDHGVLRVDGVEDSLDLGTFSLWGEHNRWNLLSAALAARTLGISHDSIQGAIATLLPLPHRLELVREDKGVLWINDSKATNAASTLVSFLALEQEVVLLLGGQGKGEDYGELAGELKATGRLATVITFGADGPTLAQDFEGIGVEVLQTKSLQQAVSCAQQEAQEGQVVLLSPACASFDAFNNFEHRGEAFRTLVQGAAP